MKLPSIFTVTATVLMLPLTLQARTWKEAGTDKSLEGDYVRTEGEQIVVKRTNGQTVKVPLARLSDEDKKFVTEQEEAKKAAATPADTDVFKWETDMEVAKKRAKAEKKDILVDFTGSDWCGWCIRLKKEVFDEPSFQEYAKKHLIMVELDFPKKTELPKELKEQNDKMAAEYKVQGFPTVLLLNSKGREVARTGYQEGGPEKYVEHVKGLLK